MLLNVGMINAVKSFVGLLMKKKMQEKEYK